MSSTPHSLDGQVPVAELAAALIDIPSPSGSEAKLADMIEKLLMGAPHLEVCRHGNTLAARTMQGHTQRVVWAGHIDTVPANGNDVSVVEEGFLCGRGSVDMKAGVAVGLKLALELTNPRVDVTWIFYDNEEVASAKNGLGLFGAAHPAWVEGDFAIVGEPSNGLVEGGCNGSLRCEVTASGTRAHSARSWMGVNAIHGVAEILNRLVAYQPAVVEVEGLSFREGLNAVGITGGVAGNVIPDHATVTINYRFAPDKTIAEALTHVQAVFAGFELSVIDEASGAKPGLTSPLVQDFVSSLGVEVAPKYGWTDVARFGEWGVAAVNFGPGDPDLAHTDDERVWIASIEACYQGLKAWFSS